MNTKRVNLVFTILIFTSLGLSIYLFQDNLFFLFIGFLIIAWVKLHIFTWFLDHNFRNNRK